MLIFMVCDLSGISGVNVEIITRGDKWVCVGDEDDPCIGFRPGGPPARKASDSKYLPYLAIASCHTEEAIKKIYADKGYYGEPNRIFLNLNKIKDSFRLGEPPARRG